MNIVLSGGGTAGHVNPAIAIAEELKERYPNGKVAFIGRHSGSENELIRKAGIPLFTVKTYGLSRKLSIENIKRIKMAFDAVKRSMQILEDLKPDAVIGTGGYVCWPVLTAARKLGIPTVLHESNSSFGLTTKLLNKKCDMFLLGMPQNKKSKNSFFVGNPLRKSFRKIPKERAKLLIGVDPYKKLIVSLGGSIGAEKLNCAIIDFMKKISVPNESIYHIHSTGQRYFEEIKNSEPKLVSGYRGCKILPYIDNISTVFSAADIVICRCGAMTLSEIAFCRTAPILIPSPNVTANHQVKNALSFAEGGGAIMIEEKDLSAETLNNAVTKYLYNTALMESVADNCERMIVKNSREIIVSKIEKLVNNG